MKEPRGIRDPTLGYGWVTYVKVVRGGLIEKVAFEKNLKEKSVMLLYDMKSIVDREQPGERPRS